MSVCVSSRPVSRYVQFTFLMMMLMRADLVLSTTTASPQSSPDQGSQGSNSLISWQLFVIVGSLLGLIIVLIIAIAIVCLVGNNRKRPFETDAHESPLILPERNPQVQINSNHRMSFLSVNNSKSRQMFKVDKNHTDSSMDGCGGTPSQDFQPAHLNSRTRGPVPEFNKKNIPINNTFQGNKRNTRPIFSRRNNVELDVLNLNHRLEILESNTLPALKERVALTNIHACIFNEEVHKACYSLNAPRYLFEEVAPNSQPHSHSETRFELGGPPSTQIGSTSLDLPSSTPQRFTTSATQATRPNFIRQLDHEGVNHVVEHYLDRTSTHDFK